MSRIVAAAGLATGSLPATDDRLRTQIVTPAGTFAFQEWFVGRGHRDDVDDVLFDGADAATPAPGALEALHEADAIVIAPSNPYVSIAPILAVRAIRTRSPRARFRCVAVSPLVGGRAVKGPADRMLSRMAGGTTPHHVAGLLRGADRRARDRRFRRARRRRASRPSPPRR